MQPVATGAPRADPMDASALRRRSTRSPDHRSGL